MQLKINLKCSNTHSNIQLLVKLNIFGGGLSPCQRLVVTLTGLETSAVTLP